MMDISSFALYQAIDDPGTGRGSLRNSVVQSACQYDVMFRVGDFQNGEQSIHRRDKKISNSSRKYCKFGFLGFRDFKIPVVIENQTLALFWNETSTGVMNFKDSLILIVEKILRAIILTGHTFEVIHQTRFTEFGGKLGNQQRPILEEIDMKARPVQSAKE